MTVLERNRMDQPVKQILIGGHCWVTDNMIVVLTTASADFN